MQKKAVDVILLQETCQSSRYILPNKFAPFGEAYPSKFYSTSGENKSDGIICFVKTQIKILDGSVTLDRGRLDYIQLKHDDFSNTVHLYHIYNYTSNANNSNMLLHRLNLHLTLSEYSRSDLVYVIGDLNINMSSSPFTPLSPGGILLDRIISSFHLVDVLGEAGEDGPTWRGRGGRATSSSRLDLILANQSELYNSHHLFSNPQSDHLVLVVLNQKLSQQDSNSVKYHPHILKNQHFIDLAVQKITAMLNTIVPDNNGHYLSIEGRDAPARYGGLEGGVTSLLNPLISIMREAHSETHKNSKKSHLQFESKYQKQFQLILKKLSSQPKNVA